MQHKKVIFAGQTAGCHKKPLKQGKIGDYLVVPLTIFGRFENKLGDLKSDNTYYYSAIYP